MENPYHIGLNLSKPAFWGLGYHFFMTNINFRWINWFSKQTQNDRFWNHFCSQCTEHQNKNKQIYLGAECQPCKHCVMYSVVIFFFGNMWRRLWPTILHWPMIRPLIFPFPFWLNGLQHQWLRPLDFLQSGLKMEKWCKD